MIYMVAATFQILYFAVKVLFKLTEPQTGVKPSQHNICANSKVKVCFQVQHTVVYIIFTFWYVSASTS